jgi:hypothetical protein
MGTGADSEMYHDGSNFTMKTTTGNINIYPASGAYISIGDADSEGGRIDGNGIRLNGGSFLKATGGTAIGIQVKESALTTGSLGSLVGPYQSTTADAFVDGTGGNLNGAIGINRDTDGPTVTLEARANGSWVSVALSGYELQGSTAGGKDGWWHPNQLLGDELVNETICIVCGEQMVPEDKVSMYANYQRADNLHAVFGHSHLERDSVIQDLTDRIHKLEEALA